ncbi:DMT family transporter [Clostridium sp. CX1]|uniref:DMT family transporter n=1 Tax=Clostridium sp. CX1 TaxID=2978346 RepID=UPI0021BEEFE9|nr:DMT family transporter [Clostridium sp. CX1]MCT8977692.1 DMT family transporter [Clostridium sp. CX1]
MENSVKRNTYFAATLYALIIGFSFLFVKLALIVTDPLNILAHRFTISFVVASIPVVFGWIKLDITFKDMLPILPISLFYPTLFFAFQAFGLVYISSSEAGIIQATIPIFTMILATFFLKENSSRLQKLSLILSVSGVIYIFVMKGIDLKPASSIGTLMIILSSLSSAGYNVLARKITKKYKILDLTYMMTFIGFLSFNLISIIDHGIHGTINVYFKPFINPLFLISVLYLGILSSLITSLLSNYTLSKIEASKMSVFNNLSTLITMIAGVIFLQESLSYFHIIGAVMIIGGVIGTNFLDKKTP